MARAQQRPRQSNRNKVKELVAIYSVSLVVMALVIHFVMPGMDIHNIINAFEALGGMPTVVAMILGIPVLMYVFAFISDYFRP